MTFSEFLAFLHECGLDVVLLGLLDGLVCALAERLPEKYGKPLSSRLRAALPFLLGVLLYAVWFFLSGRDFPLSAERSDGSQNAAWARA